MQKRKNRDRESGPGMKNRELLVPVPRCPTLVCQDRIPGTVERSKCVEQMKWYYRNLNCFANWLTICGHTRLKQSYLFMDFLMDSNITFILKFERETRIASYPNFEFYACNCFLNRLNTKRIFDVWKSILFYFLFFEYFTIN